MVLMMPMMLVMMIVLLGLLFLLRHPAPTRVKGSAAPQSLKQLRQRHAWIREREATVAETAVQAAIHKAAEEKPPPPIGHHLGWARHAKHVPNDATTRNANRVPQDARHAKRMPNAVRTSN